MSNIYYQIWVDGILNSKDYKRKDPSWKITLFFIITLSNSLNLVTVYLWLRFIGLINYLIDVEISTNYYINNTVNFALQFATPFILLNYFLIFYNNRYERLIKRIPHKKGKLALFYVLFSGLAWFISMILYSNLN